MRINSIISRAIALGMLPICLVALAEKPAETTRQAAPTSLPQKSGTVAMGSRAKQFYLAKITVSDIQKSFRFYTEIVGLKSALPAHAGSVESLLENAKNQDFFEVPLNFRGSLADPIFVLVQARDQTPNTELAALTWVGFKVPDVKATLARAAESGYPALRPMQNRGPMSFGFIKDPDGYTVEFIQAPSYPSP